MSKASSGYFKRTKGDIVDSIRSLPAKPNKKFLESWEDITNPDAKKNTDSITFKNKENGLKVRFDPKKDGKPGFECKDHWHIYNPNAIGKKDYYLDKDENPVSRVQKHLILLESEKMTVKEFIEKYHLHDSSIEKIIYEEKNERLTLNVEFCFWIQSWYIESEPKNGKISIIFDKVALFEYDEDIANKIFSEELDNEILDTTFENDELIFNIRETVSYQPMKEIFYKIKIKAESVEIKELEHYNL